MGLNLAFMKRDSNLKWNLVPGIHLLKVNPMCTSLCNERKKIAKKVVFTSNLVLCYQQFSQLPTVRKNCSTDQEKLLKFKVEGREFAKFLRSLEKCIQYLFILEVSNI